LRLDVLFLFRYPIIFLILVLVLIFLLLILLLLVLFFISLVVIELALGLGGLPPIRHDCILRPWGRMRRLMMSYDGTILVEFHATGKRTRPRWRGDGTTRGDISLLIIRVLF
jgi:hypothetical protein